MVPETLPADDAPVSLAETIRAQRADRAARVSKEREATDLKGRLEQAEAKLAKVSRADLLSDPIGFAEAAGLSQADMALVGQAYLYHLVPDKAPPDLRYKMLEAKTRRQQDATEKQQQVAEAARVQADQSSRVEQYVSMLGAAATSWEGEGDKHPYSASQAWFGGNADEYAESMAHTARNIAAAASERGEVADLTIKAVAAVLEQDIASRAARFKPRTPAAAPIQTSVRAVPAKAPGGKQPAVMSTRGQTGAPTPAAESEDERIARAIAAISATD